MRISESKSNQNILINNMKYFFYFSNLINGAFSVGLYTTVISFFENIFSPEQVNIRQGIYYAIGAFGIGFGMLITGIFLNVNGLIHQEVNDQYNSNSINWIGDLYFFLIYSIFLKFRIMKFFRCLVDDLLH